MEKFTAKEYIEAFAGNQNNIAGWREDYPDGLSLEDLSDNDTVDVMLANIHGEHDTVLPDHIVDCGEKIEISNIEEFDTKYEI